MSRDLASALTYSISVFRNVFAPHTVRLRTHTEHYRNALKLLAQNAAPTLRMENLEITVGGYKGMRNEFPPNNRAEPEAKQPYKRRAWRDSLPKPLAVSPSPGKGGGNNLGVLHEEEVTEATTVASTLTMGRKNKDTRPLKQRILMVINRLPFSAVRNGDDSWSLETCSGGLVNALLGDSLGVCRLNVCSYFGIYTFLHNGIRQSITSLFSHFVKGVKELEAKWIGWAGLYVPDEIGQRSLTKALAEKKCVPIFLDKETVNLYYDGYCNNILWRLFNYLGLPHEDCRPATTHSLQPQFDAYKKANQMFADMVARHYEDGDVVWCHDYHLMFLPKFLKEYNSKMKVGWFLHTPFPSSEVHRMLPSRSELLISVLAADLVGFHTYDYARHFVSACTRILGFEGTHQGVENQGKLTRVSVFPVGIDFDRFLQALELPQVQDNIKELTERFAGQKVILGVDRLDMIKGIPQKLLAFEKFLEDNPKWQEKLVLLQIAIPTRDQVPEYRKLKSQVHEIVGRVNGRFGTLTAVPIHHLDYSIDFHSLCALYAFSDVILLTSLRDGMNLASYEYVACQDSKKGVLILSEFAGAAQSLGAGAILVNPWNITEVALSIGHALNMPADEREKRHQHNFQHVTTHTSQEWTEMFVSELNDTIAEAQIRTRRVQPLLPVKATVECFLQTSNHFLILGFNATMTEPVVSPGKRRDDQIKEMELKLHSELKEPLAIICNDPKTTVLVISGSSRAVLDDNFGDYNLWLAAEHGIFLRSTKGEWMTTMPDLLDMDWVDSVKAVLEYFKVRTPRSYLEFREILLSWNYKYADVEFGRLQAWDMLQHLWTGPISNAAVDIVQGSRSVEIRPVGVTKGTAIDSIIGQIAHAKSMVTPFDYVLCLGHFLGKDEDIYEFFEPVLPTADEPTVDAVRTSSSRWSSPKVSKMPHEVWRTTSSAESTSVARNNEGPSVLDLNSNNYFSCAVGRSHSKARYLMESSEDVVSLLVAMAAALSSDEK
ncbi:alpha,alpha-trehalose-phosphate synthase [UDP-forming] 1-like [Magnolia sinica]|uniref:alpha,alpha-trehalose-phosphate synthase [UDP-forming] 1-like n=1 Tax=Magnolia sinica TaxID=86752 RepID=UPI00265B39B9|nr:alpha,alpha-trehalose-phosphate synthase [UDP-forming] 1-like [Magnolia sinica]